MHQMLKCGQPTEACVRAVARAFRAENKQDLSAALHGIAQKVSQGKPLSRAAEHEYILFTDIHRAAILAGEASNNMTEAFHLLQILEDKKIQSQRSGMAEIITPTVLFGMSCISLFNTGLNTMPTMAQMSKAQGKEVAAIPRMLMEFTGAVADYWYFILTAFIIFCVTAYSVAKSAQGRFWIDSYVLRIPGLGKFIAYKTYASMLLYFPHLIASGVKPKQMIPIMEALATNAILKRRIDLFNQVITTGGQMSSAMEKAGFPIISVTPVKVSESYSGNNKGVNDVMIDGMNHAYSILERELNDAYAKFVGVFSTIMWLLGGSVLLLEMLSIVMAQN
tara:strand:- start:255315 stop:256319 length:1005 start_codon:yes stop_codon:yes gene_type:complete